MLRFTSLLALALSTVAAQAAPDHVYLANETGGSILHDTAGTVNGVLGSRATLGGGALTFAPSGPFASDSYVDFGNSLGQFGTKDFAILFDINTTSTSVNSDVLSNRADGTYGNYVSIRLSSGRIVLEVAQDTSGTDYGSVFGNALINNGAWHTVLATRTGSQYRLTVDGRLDGSTTAGGIANIANSNDFFAGYSPIASTYGLAFTGKMRDIVFNPVPEPGTWGALGLGAVAMLRRRKRA